MSLPRFLPKSLCVALFLAVVCVGSASGQKNPPPPKYDLQSETKIKGIVEELKPPAKGSEKEVTHLLLKNGADTVDVYLCPASFLEDMGMTFKKGDEITLTGSKVKQDASDLVLAREVLRGTDALVLRDDKGAPVWNWRH